MNPLSFRQIAFDSPDYKKACDLRDRVLRQPLGLCLYDEDLTKEPDQLHFGLFDDNSAIIACIIAVPESSTVAKLRQMAVCPQSQRNGHGATMLKSLENHLRPKGYLELNLNARSTAISFYKKAGYQESGASFLEVGIPHVLMKKYL